MGPTLTKLGCKMAIAMALGYGEVYDAVVKADTTEILLTRGR